MVRTQIQLSEDQSRRIKQAAVRRGVSVAELIRQGVEAVLRADTEPTQEEKRRRAAHAAGRFHSGKKDVATHHDHYLEQAYSE